MMDQHPHPVRGRRGRPPAGCGRGGRRANSLNRVSQYERGGSNGYDDEDYLEEAATAGVSFQDDYVSPG